MVRAPPGYAHRATARHTAGVRQGAPDPDLAQPRCSGVRHPPARRLSGADLTPENHVSSPTPDDLVQRAFEELGRMSFAEHSLESVLRKVTDLAARVLPGEPVTSVTIVANGRSSTVAASGRLALDLDRAQYEQGSGPCLQAALTGELVELLDTDADDRWPPFPR